MAATVVEELVSVLGIEIGENALATLNQFRSAMIQGLTGVGGMVAALGAAFAGTVVSTAHLGAEVNKVAQQIGISTDAVQELKYAADATNVSWESMTVGLKFLSKNAAEGAEASKRIGEALGGVSMRNANGQLKTADELLEAFADKIAAIKDPIEQVKVAMHGMHGQSGVEKMPLLKLGGEGIRRLRQEARDLGIVLDKETLAASDRFYKGLTRLKYALLSVRNVVGAPFIQDFTDALDRVAEVVREVRPWFQDLTKTIRELGQRFGRVVETGKRAYETVRKFITDIKLDKLADGVHWMEMLEAAMIGIAAVGVTSAAAVAAGWILAAAPFILIATLIGLIIDDIAHFVTGGESVLGMAEKWSHAFDPKDSNMIRFFKEVLSLLMDLGDPAKWKRVSDAAKKGLYGILYDESAMDEYNKKNPENVYGTQNDPRAVGGRPAGLPGSVIRDMPASTWEEYARKQQTPQFRPGAQPVALSDADQAAVEKYLWDHGMLAKGVSIKSLSADDRHHAEDVLKGKGLLAPNAVFNVTIQGASDPNDPRWIRKLQEFADRQHSDAKAALAGEN